MRDSFRGDTMRNRWDWDCVAQIGKPGVTGKNPVAALQYGPTLFVIVPRDGAPHLVAMACVPKRLRNGELRSRGGAFYVVDGDRVKLSGRSTMLGRLPPEVAVTVVKVLEAAVLGRRERCRRARITSKFPP